MDELTTPPEMSKEQVSNYSAFLALLHKHDHLGIKKFEDGSIAIGHVPHLAPLAYLHRLYSPLDSEEIERLQDELDSDFPESLISFFKLHNGLGLFADGFVAYGQRHSWQRTDIEAALQQPYSIQSANIDRMPKRASNDQLAISSIGPDRSPITIDKNGHVYIWHDVKSRTPDRTYADLFEFLLGETQRLSLKFDQNGRAVSGQHH